MVIKHSDQVCGHCGIKFRRKKLQPYCSRECYAKANTKLRPCPICGELFPSHPKTTYCSKGCLQTALKKREPKVVSAEARKNMSEGGKNQEYNLVLSCRSCNSKKRTKSMENYAINEGENWPEKWEHIYTTALIIKDRINDRRSNI